MAAAAAAMAAAAMAWAAAAMVATVIVALNGNAAQVIGSTRDERLR